MPANRIRDGCNSSNRTYRIRPGDLVVVNKDFIDESYYKQLKDFTGLVTQHIKHNEMPALIEVFWTDGVVEKMYEDELDKV